MRVRGGVRPAAGHGGARFAQHAYETPQLAHLAVPSRGSTRRPDAGRQSASSPRARCHPGKQRSRERERLLRVEARRGAVSGGLSRELRECRVEDLRARRDQLERDVVECESSRVPRRRRLYSSSDARPTARARRRGHLVREQTGRALNSRVARAPRSCRRRMLGTASIRGAQDCGNASCRPRPPARCRRAPQLSHYRRRSPRRSWPSSTADRRARLMVGMLTERNGSCHSSWHHRPRPLHLRGGPERPREPKLEHFPARVIALGLVTSSDVRRASSPQRRRSSLSERAALAFRHLALLLSVCVSPSSASAVLVAIDAAAAAALRIERCAREFASAAAPKACATTPWRAPSHRSAGAAASPLAPCAGRDGLESAHSVWSLGARIAGRGTCQQERRTGRASFASQRAHHAMRTCSARTSLRRLALCSAEDNQRAVVLVDPFECVAERPQPNGQRLRCRGPRGGFAPSSVGSTAARARFVLGRVTLVAFEFATSTPFLTTFSTARVGRPFTAAAQDGLERWSSNVALLDGPDRGGPMPPISKMERSASAAKSAPAKSRFA